MRFASSHLRPLAFGLLAVSLVGLTGCSWFKKGPKGDYALPAEQRPLEVPPDLTMPSNNGAMQVPNTASQASSQAARPATAGNGFNVRAARDDAFSQLGDALGAIDGVTIASRAQLLGTYDVNYQGSDFLVRVVGLQDGSYISAVDPRGLPATSEAAVALMADLKTRLNK
ncbi:hypothetical protein [Pseudoxanthomonas dokdonensis]|uniref:Beta-barrel assembly machine subunit BamC n=1 Tax=Pseudoxanthomonas dokdonensis TaxID=344882 RepID=A0A0R0CIY4_9GAMM|nr:hypothetical protein [Pseudoxanthomonas dokdonensis]KRG69206.1 hypothetical protein ABB29_10765 [Pseudoxanthomonas dokdonensis]